MSRHLTRTNAVPTLLQSHVHTSCYGKVEIFEFYTNLIVEFSVTNFEPFVNLLSLSFIFFLSPPCLCFRACCQRNSLFIM